MSTLSIRKALTGTAFVAALVATAASAQAANYSYGGVKFFGPAYSYPTHNGQSGNVTFFGAPPTTLPTHNGQYGGVTFLGGVHPTTLPSHNGQSGNVTFFAPTYTYQGHNGQSGNVTFFGAPPTTLPSHNGQSGTVTFLNGVKPSTYPGHNGQVGNLTFLGKQPAGTVRTPIVPSPHIIPTPTVRVPTIAPRVVLVR